MAETYWERRFWDPEIETMPRKELRKLQEKKLFRELVYAYENAPFYHELYDKEKVDVYKIRTIEDFQKYVPPIDKEMFRKYRERTGDILGGACCLPLNASGFPPTGVDVFAGRLFRSTGTTGMPTCFMYTERDTKGAITLAAREWWRMGERPNDRVYQPFGEVMAWHGGSLFDVACHREIGALPYFENIAEPELGLKIAKIFDINIIYLGLPNVRPLSQRMEREGTTLKASYFPRLKFASVTGELSKNTLEYHAKMLGVPVFSHWFVTEAAFIGGCCSNEAQQTGAAFHQHLPEDMHFIEIFPPELDTAVDKAEFGEFVITNMFFESMAYIRFRTEDMGQVRYDPCPYCGYTHMQARVMSRVTESVNVKGKLITMAEIEDILLSYPEVRFLPEQIIREEPQPQDRLRLRLCYNTELVKEPEQFRLRMEDEFNKRLGVDAVVDLITPEEVRALVHKWERVVKEKRQG